MFKSNAAITGKSSKKVVAYTLSETELNACAIQGRDMDIALAVPQNRVTRQRAMVSAVRSSAISVVAGFKTRSASSSLSSSSILVHSSQSIHLLSRNASYQSDASTASTSSDSDLFPYKSTACTSLMLEKHFKVLDTMKHVQRSPTRMRTRMSSVWMEQLEAILECSEDE